MYTNYYRKYVAEGRCTKCGMSLPEGFEYRDCDRCRERDKLQRRRRRMEERERREAEEREANKKPGPTLDELSRLAKERGISYGQLVSEMEGKRHRTKED